MLKHTVNRYIPALIGVTNMDTNLLSSLDRKALLTLAKAYEEFAKRARTRAAEIKQGEDTRIEMNQHLNSFQNIGPAMLASLNLHEYDHSKKILSKHFKTLPETIEYHYKRYLRRRDAAAIERRHRLVASLARRGLNNRQIATRTGLHHVSVCRILKPILRP